MNVPSEEAASQWIPKVVGMDTGQNKAPQHKLAKYAEGDRSAPGQEVPHREFHPEWVTSKTCYSH